MAESVESKHGICLCACCSFENHDAHGPCGHPCTEPEDKPLGAEASVRVLNAELNAVGIGKRPQYADLCRAIHGILAAYAAAQRVIAELREDQCDHVQLYCDKCKTGPFWVRDHHPLECATCRAEAAEARCAELTKERESFKQACFEASEESRQAWLASETRNTEQAARIEKLERNAYVCEDHKDEPTSCRGCWQQMFLSVQKEHAYQKGKRHDAEDRVKVLEAALAKVPHLVYGAMRGDEGANPIVVHAHKTGPEEADCAALGGQCALAATGKP